MSNSRCSDVGTVLQRKRLELRERSEASVGDSAVQGEIQGGQGDEVGDIPIRENGDRPVLIRTAD